MASNHWVQAEINAIVDAYLDILAAEESGAIVNKAAINRGLRAGPLSARSRGSVEMRMCNISAVLDDFGEPYIDGYKPRKHVGSRAYGMISTALAKHQKTKSSKERFRDTVDFPEVFDRDAVLRALERIDREGFNPHYPSHTYVVVHEGKTYPPPAVVAFAIEEIRGEPIPPGAIRGGAGTPAFKVLDELGFLVKRISALPTDDREELENRVIELRKQGVPKKPPRGNQSPTRGRPNKGKPEFIRDPEVAAWVLENAKGICELCGNAAPFISRATGKPYLEAHHVQPLAEDGPDTPQNCVALCPNCHRHCHFGEDKCQSIETLFCLVRRLVSSH